MGNAEVPLDSQESLPRPSRHIEVKVEWTKEQTMKRHITVRYKKGAELMADLLTKCLPTPSFLMKTSNFFMNECNYMPKFLQM